MVTRRAIGEIKTADLRWKPGGQQFNEDAIKLNQLFENRGRALTYEHLRTISMGDPKNEHPLCVGTIPRLTESLSVLYRVPATRMLKRGGSEEILDDTDPDMQTYNEMCRRMMIDNVWQLVDARRNLMRQCAVSFVESAAHDSVQARIFAPFEMFRDCTPTAADCIEEDAAFLFQTREGNTTRERIYQLWQHEDDGWYLWIVDEDNHLIGKQPYGDDGKVPFKELPVIMVYDELPIGRAYLPIPESRLDFAMNINALVNDLAYLVKLEAHTAKLITTDDRAAAPTEVGPDKLTILPTGSTMSLLAHTPQIDSVNKTIAGQLAQFALSDSLPADYFSADRQIRTGPALKVSERDLDARRQRQAPIAVETERRAFKKFRAVHNMFAKDFGMRPLDEKLELVASFGRQWQPTDAKELQETWFKDISIGVASAIAYIQERFNLDRRGAIDWYRQQQKDAKDYPVQQNPAALVEGQNPALGRDAAQKVPGAFNPDVASSTEGASVTDAVRSSAPGTGN